MIKKYIFSILVTQIVPHAALCHEDTEDNPSGEHVVEIYSNDVEEALDEFHATVPIGCLDDFEIDAEKVGEREYP